MNDEQMLRFAAKAAGLEVRWTEEDVFKGSFLRRVIPEPQPPASKWLYWRPLIDDGDAFCLAIDLGIQIHVEGSGDSEAVWADDTMIWVNSEFIQGDRRKAAREAIVSVAAQRGEQMP